MDIQINDVPYNAYGYDKDVHYFDKNGRRLYRVDLYLSGMDLPFVNNVTYHLHSTFNKGKINVKRTMYNPACKYTIWVWGKFRMPVIVEDNKGVKHTFIYYLTFDKHFNDEYVKFVKEVR